ncbi:sulfotransferase domain-containing protein [Rhodoblastus sp.]|uniref:sulfotransferase domain-containing protein n=1 Tax=Rhodoblastus sp. TaxID=1962975 RepID=UPI002623EBB8|nr:sulfotransferase domain-containing protein [Rhodoblastus sp.]
MDCLDQIDEGARADAEGAESSEAKRRQRAIWIASYPKSGNTWVRVFLHNLLRELRGDTEGAQSINALHEMTGREALKPHFDRRLGKPADQATPQEIAEARFAVQADLTAGAGGPLFIKTHNAVANVEGFPTINFDVTLAAVYLVRNPLDVAVSYAHYSGLPVEPIIDHMADSDRLIETSPWRVYEFVGSWSFHVASWLSVPHRPVIILRYEDLLAVPERNFARLASFLRLRPNREQLQRAIEKSSFGALARQEAAEGFVEKPPEAEKFFRTGKAGQWKDILSPDQIKTIVAAHGPMMMRFGYVEERCGA